MACADKFLECIFRLANSVLAILGVGLGLYGFFLLNMNGCQAGAGEGAGEGAGAGGGAGEYSPNLQILTISVIVIVVAVSFFIIGICAACVCHNKPNGLCTYIVVQTLLIIGEVATSVLILNMNMNSEDIVVVDMNININRTCTSYAYGTYTYADILQTDMRIVAYSLLALTISQIILAIMAYCHAQKLNVMILNNPSVCVKEEYVHNNVCVKEEDVYNNVRSEWTDERLELALERPPMKMKMVVEMHEPLSGQNKNKRSNAYRY